MTNGTATRFGGRRQAGGRSLQANSRPDAPGGRDGGLYWRLDAIARLLDSRWRIPGTGIRFGADPVLNLLPGIGLLASKGVSAYLLWEAWRIGVPGRTLLRMLGHLGLDALISAVPVLGWAGDIFYRANLRNMALLRAHLERQASRTP